MTLDPFVSAGANLEVDVAWKYLNFFLDDDERLAHIGAEYGAGRMLTGEIKAELIQARCRGFSPDQVLRPITRAAWQTMRGACTAGQHLASSWHVTLLLVVSVMTQATAAACAALVREYELATSRSCVRLLRACQRMRLLHRSIPESVPSQHADGLSPSSPSRLRTTKQP